MAVQFYTQFNETTAPQYELCCGHFFKAAPLQCTEQIGLNRNKSKSVPKIRLGSQHFYSKMCIDGLLLTRMNLQLTFFWDLSL